MTTVTAVSELAQGWVMVQPGDWDPNSGHGPEWGKAAPAGLLIWLFLGVALFLLIKSMNRHMRKVPKTFDTDGDGTDGSAAATGVAMDDHDLAAVGEVVDGEAAHEPVGTAPSTINDAR